MNITRFVREMMYRVNINGEVVSVCPLVASPKLYHVSAENLCGRLH